MTRVLSIEDVRWQIRHQELAEIRAAELDIAERYIRILNLEAGSGR